VAGLPAANSKCFSCLVKPDTGLFGESVDPAPSIIFSGVVDLLWRDGLRFAGT
jgi:hypothetical protein